MFSLLQNDFKTIYGRERQKPIYIFLINFHIFYSDEQRDARILKGLRNVNSNDSYDMEDVVMPLEEFINKPVAWDIVHNGATFQVFFPMVHFCPIGFLCTIFNYFDLVWLVASFLLEISLLLCANLDQVSDGTVTFISTFSHHLLSNTGCRVDKQLIFIRISWSASLCAEV